MSMGPADLQKLPVGFTAAMLERLPHTEAEIDAKMAEAYSINGYGPEGGIKIDLDVYSVFLWNNGRGVDVVPDFRRWVIAKYTSAGWRRVTVEVDHMVTSNYAKVVFTFCR